MIVMGSFNQVNLHISQSVLGQAERHHSQLRSYSIKRFFTKSSDDLMTST